MPKMFANSISVVFLLYGYQHLSTSHDEGEKDKEVCEGLGLNLVATLIFI